MLKFYCRLYFPQAKRFVTYDDLDMTGDKIWTTLTHATREEAQLDAIYAYTQRLKPNFLNFGLSTPTVELITFNSSMQEVGRTKLYC